MVLEAELCLELIEDARGIEGSGGAVTHRQEHGRAPQTLG
jgi:hypothetical protein